MLLFTASYVLVRKPAGFNRLAPYLYTYTYNFSRLDRHLPKGSLFVQFWSLAIEEQFYLVWPFVIYFFAERRLRKVLIAIIVLAPVFRVCLAARGLGVPAIGSITYGFTFSQFDAFAFGAAIPVFGLPQRVKRTGLLAGSLCALALAAGLANYWLLRRQGADVPLSSLGLGAGWITHFDHVWSYTVVDLAFMAVTLHLASPGYQGLFNSGPLVGIGKIVYGLYIFHYVILVGIVRIDQRYVHNAVVCFALACGACWLTAYASYNGFEKKFLALRSRVRARPADPIPSGAGDTG